MYDEFQYIGYGLNFTRKGLLALLGQVMSGDIDTVVVVDRVDFLARFGTHIIKWICQQQNC